jgi:hypothetical protein
MAGTHWLAQPHIRCLEKLPENHEVVSTNGDLPLVRGPKGEWLRLKPNGRLVAFVKRVQSYLDVYG